ncbi:unnamed protein product [Peronospora belbahrii]|uniref:Uncharacterized protein n=1 Tax=Peronospora belbahrii TaxID=622444 RepID=A0AAU9KUJ4_9STRA|nr:unnamed protein product [Peronospora belbahrii]
MDQHAEAPRRKRKSRFSDAQPDSVAPVDKNQAVNTAVSSFSLDPAALARAAAAKIARAIPGPLLQQLHPCQQP